ncbi:hypothetical protein K4L06_20715 [Lysobacter sp. BMK333-48F3]|uniref:Lipoprotein n=1 Tax=Lysobacter firmicutimachus TaxID=1792846 RepID=A0AAU8MT47_9GAMM|nr:MULTISPECIES: hypothetical protein [Lysobacter]MBX9403736.1 hypothetical protein [Lysobacter sp. BMK333-48F3]
MLKRASKLLGICAFCFGAAFSMSAFGAGGCQSCWDNCQVQFDQCMDSGSPAYVCQTNWRHCGLSCGCDIP